jgi:dTDP-4-dehydrorhamnose 3,5-epimerase/reductase
MQKIETPIKGAFILEPRVHGDARGFFYEAYNKEKFHDLGIEDEIMQVNHSRSEAGVLRGMHFQYPPKAMSKIVRCTRGRVWDVIVDMRQDSPSYKQWFGVELSDDNKSMFYIPAGCAHGFYAFEDCDFQYLVGHSSFAPEFDAGFAWNDPEVGIQWPLRGEPSLSNRDQVQPSFNEVIERVNAKPKRVLITGANGGMGSVLVKEFRSAGYDVLATDKDTLDITNGEEVHEFMKAEKPDIIINSAAYNFVDDAEERDGYEKAYAINALGPENLAREAASMDIPFVHYSTDYVFDGRQTGGYTENDEPRPISKYGESKAAGEQLVRRAGGQWYICRMSKLFGPSGNSLNAKPNFVDLMLRLATEKPMLQIVDEENGNPTYTVDAAAMTRQVLEGCYESGVYHLVSGGPAVTPFEFAEEVFVLGGIDTPRERVSADAFPRAAARPKFAQLHNTKLPPLRSRIVALRHYLDSLT